MVTRIYKNVIPAYNGLYRICNIMDVLSTRDRARTIIETQIQLKLAADARKMTSVPPIADAKDARFPAKKPKEDEYQPLTIAHYEQKRDSLPDKTDLKIIRFADLHTLSEDQVQAALKDPNTLISAPLAEINVQRQKFWDQPEMLEIMETKLWPDEVSIIDEKLVAYPPKSPHQIDEVG